MYKDGPCSFFFVLLSSFSSLHHSIHFTSFIPFSPIPSRSIPSHHLHPIQFHSIPSRPIPSQHNPSHHIIPSHSKPSHPILAYLRDVVSATGLSSHRKDKPGLGSPNSLESFLKNGHPMFSSGHIECFDTCLDHS